MPVQRILLSACALVLHLGFTAPAQARENYAILIGASTYQNLDERYWLVGPANDVDLVRSYLVQNDRIPFAAENIAVLADGVEGGTPPTLAAIRTAMADLATRLQPDDFVYLHFSGHGSQMPALDPDSELDGLDEVFLPVDIGPWNDEVGTIENALIDDEIGQMIASLRASGASVWAVFDSCHSGTVTRGAPTGDDDVRMRKLDSAALGIPDKTMTRVQSRALPDPHTQPASPVENTGDAGSFVAFFAAQTTETTPEKRLPRGDPERRSQGVFTYTLFETLASRPGISYRQLGQEILRRYSVNNMARSTPMFEGDLDAPVFFSGNGDTSRQWPVEITDGIVKLPAGRLHGLEEGAILAIMASPADPVEDAIGYVSVDFAESLSSELLPVAYNDVAALAAADIPKGAYLRKLSENLSFGLTVALPEPGSAAAERLTAALDFARTAELISPRIQLVEAGQPADLRLAVLPDSDRPDAIWILPSTGLMSSSAFAATPSVDTLGKTPEVLADALADSLARIARVQNLLKLGGAYSGDTLDVDVRIQTRSPSTPQLRTLDTLPVPRMIPDDEIHLLARNHESVPIDLNVLYIGSDYSITHMFSGRLQPGDRLKQGLLRITDDAFGRDRIIMVLSPAKPQSVIEDLSFLEQNELPTTRGVTDGGFRGALNEAGFGATTRAAAPLGGGGNSGPDPAILMIDIDTRPKS